MKQIKDIREYKELIRWNKARFASVVTNCMVMSDTISGFLSSERLFCEIYDNGLALFVDEGRYYNLYYFWNKDTPFASFRRDKPVLVEELSSNASRDACITRKEQALADAGFTRIRNNLQVEKRADSDTLFPLRVDALREKGLRLEYCRDARRLDQVTALWEAHLDITDIPADHYILGTEAVILNVIAPDDSVAATHYWKTNGKSSECRHTVTHPGYYRQGLATVLIASWLNHSAQQGAVRWLTWISDRNERSLSLYRSLGFLPNGRTSRQYLLPKE